jgi:hypothetical protein
MPYTCMFRVRWVYVGLVQHRNVVMNSVHADQLPHRHQKLGVQKIVSLREQYHNNGGHLHTILLWLYSPLLGLGHFFGFLIYTQSVGLLGRWISSSQGFCLHTEQHKHILNAYRHPCLEWDSNPRSQCLSGRRQLCLRPRGYCYRTPSYTQNKY